jgi:F-type H+-transporting ATPase subunit b
MAEFISELVGFVVILFVLWRFILPLVKKLVIDRQDAVQKQVDEAEEATRNLEAAQARFDSAVEQAKGEAARIRDDARADSTRIREELVAQAEQEVERIKQRGRDQLVAQRDQVVRGLRSEIGGTSMQLAERVVVESLADDTARSATVDSFLTEIETMPARADAGIESESMPARADDSRQAAAAGGGAS